MVFLLIFNVSCHHINLSRINRKTTISPLPIKLFIFFSLCLNPFRRMGFYLFNKFHQCNFSRQQTKDMNVVFIPANFYP